MTREHMPEPCTEEANEQGCSCDMYYAGFYSLNPPEPRINPHCPLHGRYRDPDAMREDRAAAQERNAGLGYDE